MATATASSSSTTPPATTAGGQGADDNYPAPHQGADGADDPQGGDASPAEPPAPAAPATSSAGQGDGSFSPSADEIRLAEPLRAERRKSNQLEKEIRTLRQQLNRFSEINPEKYSRIQEAERQKQVLVERMELRERQMEEASAQKVAAVASERDDAMRQNNRCPSFARTACSSAPSPRPRAEMVAIAGGPSSTSSRGSWGVCFRLGTDKEGKDVLEPLDGQGKPLLGDDGRPLTTADFLDEMRVHPVFGFLFQERGPAGMQAVSAMTDSGIASNG